MNNNVDSNVGNSKTGRNDSLSLRNNQGNRNHLNNLRNSNNNNNNRLSNNPRKLRGNKLGSTVGNNRNKNNNPMSRNNPQKSNGMQNNGIGKRNTRFGGGGFGRSRTGNNASSEQNNSSNETLNKKTNSTSSNLFSNKESNSFSDESSSEENSELKIKVKIPLAVKIKIVVITLLIIVAILAILFVVACVVVFFSGGVSTTGKIQDDNYCKTLEVTFCSDESTNDNCIPDTELVENGVGTYDLETYVAGVVTGEVGHFQNDEPLKALAVAARTYVLYHTKGSSECKVNSWSNFQVMKPNPTARAIQAAKDTEGETLYDYDGNLINSQYDAFACYDKDDEHYYIMQGNLIPIVWAEEVGVPERWTSCTMVQAHGNGMSQYGALYLAETQGYNYHEILGYYYGDQIKGFFCSFEEKEGSCNPDEDEECEVEYEKVCEKFDDSDETDDVEEE